MTKLMKRGKVWYIRARVNGKDKWISCKTEYKSQAQDYLNEMEAKGYNNVPFRSRNRISLGSFLETHLANARLEVSPRWLKEKKIIFDAHLRPFFGEDTALEDITTARIKEYQAARIQDGVSTKTINKEVSQITRLLRDAILNNLIPPHCVPVVKRLKEAPGRLRFLSLEEIPKVKQAAIEFGPEMEAYVMLCLYAGLRSGEALHLRWMDVSLARKFLSIEAYEDLDDLTGAPIRWAPKTNQRRSVPLLPELHRYLQDRERAVQGSKFVVRGKSRVSYDLLVRGFRDMAKAAGLEIAGETKVTCHTLRHSFASHLVMNGVSIYDLSKLLGHNSVSTTEIYAHLAQSHLDNAVKKISY